MTKDELVKNSGEHSDAVGILTRLAEHSPWDSVIKLGEVTGGGYGLVNPNDSSSTPKR
jgi:hypothetical protein